VCLAPRVACNRSTRENFGSKLLVRASRQWPDPIDDGVAGRRTTAAVRRRRCSRRRASRQRHRAAACAVSTGSSSSSRMCRLAWSFIAVLSDEQK